MFNRFCNAVMLIQLHTIDYNQFRSFLQIAEKRTPHVVNLASQGERVHKRQLSYSNIRIHSVLTSIPSTATKFVEGNDSPLSKAIDTLQSLLLVHPVQGNLIIPPECAEYTNGSNEGKCISPLPSQSNFECGDFGVIPLPYIGTREVCSSNSGPCVVEGPDGPGLPNADYLLFVSVFSCKYSLFNKCLIGGKNLYMYIGLWVVKNSKFHQ